MSKDQNQTPQAVIYCRVSGAKQVREGDGLASQETRCREYARHKGYQIADVFTDDITGKTQNRPGMQSMLGYLHMNANKSAEIIVIIDDISRLARGLNAHLELRQSLAQAGGKLESPSIEFGEDSDSVLVENLLASVAQHQREKNGEQTKNRMKGRLMNGYSVFPAPVGYTYEKTAGRGKLLVRDEPIASIVQEALEGYATGRFESQAEIKRFLETQPAFPKDLPNGQIRQQKVSDLLNRVIYAGCIEHEDWGITRRKGHHEPIISLETFEAIQERKNTIQRAPTRKDINEDFPLRGFVTCSCCDAPMTACWSKSATGKRHAYYWCQTRSCDLYRKSIRRDVVEGAFEETLQRMQPSKNVFEVFTSMFKHAWSMRQDKQAAAQSDLKRQISKLDKTIDGLLDRIVESENGSVIAAYEKRIAKLESEKLNLSEKLTKNDKPKHSFEEIFERASLFLSSPWNIYTNGTLTMKRLVLRLAFKGPLAFDKENGFRTPQVSDPFKFFEKLTSKCEMVRSRRLELPRVLPHSDLNAARLPIPPRPHVSLVPGLYRSDLEM